MSLYFIRPVVWNNKGYKTPSAAHFTSGYPKENGFGHQEWNNSDFMDVEFEKRKLHLFHTESLGNQELDAYSASIFVFMIASYESKQYLVSIAGNATALFDAKHKASRLKLLSKIQQASMFSEEAWAVPGVRAAYRDDQAEFRRRWKAERHWFVDWFCPAELYLGLLQPLMLDAMSLTGKKRLISMYGSYQEIALSTAQRIVSLIPDTEDAARIAAITKALGNASLDVTQDLMRLTRDDSDHETMRVRL